MPCPHELDLHSPPGPYDTLTGAQGLTLLERGVMDALADAPLAGWPGEQRQEEIVNHSAEHVVGDRRSVDKELMIHEHRRKADPRRLDRGGRDVPAGCASLSDVARVARPYSSGRTSPRTAGPRLPR